MAYTTIDDPSEYFHTLLYTGNGNDDRAITNSANSGNFQPDWLWIKERSSTSSHRLFDSSRGASKRIDANTDSAEGTDTSQQKSFDSNGFTVGTSGSTNANGDTYVAWQWKANGGTTSSFTESGNNPGGTIQTNTTAGFSIITTTGTGNTGTIAHGLGAVPEIIISKQRSNAENWAIYHGSNTDAPETEILTLNTTDATADNANGYNDTAPTSSVFTVHTKNEVNTDARTYVHYVFTPIQGYSKFGSYTGNGNADGPFVYTGFKPAWVMIKRTSGTENWVLWDNKRDPFNNFYHVLLPNASSAEDTSNAGSGGRYVGDFLSNGFKLRNTHDTSNSSSDYIYMAFAESPFVSSEGVPTTAR